MREAPQPFTLKNIGFSRALLMGLATLWVTYSHCWDLDFSQSHLLNSLNLVDLSFQIRDFGNAGVDIFLFLSGFGLFHSLSRSPQIRSFYIRRFRRVLPPVLIVSVIYYGLTGSGQPLEYLFQIFHLSIYHPVFTRGLVWFFSMLVPLYLLYPLFHRIIDRYRLPGAAGLILLTVLLSFGLRAVNRSYFEKIEIVLMRIPVFIAGIAAAKGSSRNKPIPTAGMITVCIVTVLYFLAIPRIPIPEEIPALARYCYFPLTLGVCLSVSFIDRMIPDNPLRRFIVLTGTYSLEIYMIFEILYKALRESFLPETGIGIPFALACFTGTLILAFALRKCSDIIVQALQTPGKPGERGTRLEKEE